MRKYSKNLIFIFIIGALLTSTVGAEVLSSGQLNNPYKLAVSNGYLYSVDTANNKIKKFDSSGNLIYLYGSYGNGNGQFNQPQGIAADSNGYVYVVDTGNQRIQKLYDNGKSFSFVQSITDIPGLSDPTFLFPRSIRVDDNGDIFIVDTAKNRVIKYSTGTVVDGSGQGGISAQSAGAASGIFNAPYGADIDANGYVYIADTENHRIKKYSLSGKLLLEFGSKGLKDGQFLYPSDVAVDPNGNIYVADTGNHRVQKFNRFGKYIMSFGGLETSDDKFFAPRGVFVSESGYLYVVGADNKIQKFDVAYDIVPPLGFILENPPDGYLVDGKDIKISWSEAQDEHLDHYDLVVGTELDDIHGTAIYSATFESFVKREVWLRDLPRGKYYIYMAAYDKTGHYCRLDGTTNVEGYHWPDLASNWAAAWPSFEIDPIPPKPFTISNIYNGQYFDGRDVKIAWNEANDTDLDHYELYIGTDQNDIMNTAVYTATFDATVRECLVDLPGGIYWICMRAYDKLGNFRGLDGKTNAPKHDLDQSDNLISFEIDNTPPTIAFNQIAYPPLTNLYFSPNGDGAKDNTEIRFNITDDSYYRDFPATMEVKVEILDNTDNIVKTWEIPESISGWQKLNWDGITNDSQLATDGVYKIKISATDKALNTSIDESLQVVIDTTPPEINNIANSEIFSPNGDGQFDTDTLTFNLSDNLTESLNTKVEILDQNNEIIWNVESEEPRIFEPLSVSWDGKPASGIWNPVSDGIYRYRIIVEDQAGNRTINDSTLVRVDTTSPTIANVSTSPKTEVAFTETSGSLDISYAVSERVNVRVAIMDSNYSIIKDYVVEAEPGVTNTISWDGRDSFGSLIQGNTYITYAFSATDQVANSSSYSSNDIIKVSTPITGVAGNILYSPDGMVKIIVPAGAMEEDASLYINVNDTPPKSYQISDKDNITLTYEFGPPEILFNKACTVIMNYDSSVLTNPDQDVEMWAYGSPWKKVYGGTHSPVFTSYLDETCQFALFADVTPPNPPVIDQPTSPTNQSLISLSGNAEPNSKVRLTVNGVKLDQEIIVDEQGNWNGQVSLQEGENTIFAKASDSIGNESLASELIYVTLDTTPPDLTVNSSEFIYISPNGDGVQDDAEISCDSMDAVTIAISIRNEFGTILASSNSNTLTWGDPSAVEGTYTYVIKAFDSMGNETTYNGEIIVDKTLPEAYLEADPISYFVSGNLSLYGIAEDTNFESYILEYGIGANPSSWTNIEQGFNPINYTKFADFDTTFLADGSYTFRLTAYDKAGNTKLFSLTKQIVNSELLGTILSPAPNQIINGTTGVHGNITGSNFLEYDIEYGFGADPSSWVQITNSTAMPADTLLGNWDTTQVVDGAYTLRLNVKNIANRSSYYTVPVMVDNGNPGISITSPAANAVLGSNIDIDAEINDPNFSYYTVEYADSNNPSNWYAIRGPTYTISSPLATWDTQGLNGNYIIKVTVVDQVNNSSFGSVAVTLDNTDPEASITSPSNGSILNETIPILGTATDLHFSSYKLEYGFGTSPASWTEIVSSSSIVPHPSSLVTWDTSALGTDGIYTIKLTVTDQAGNTSTSSVSLTIDNTNPTALITFPTENSVIADTIDILGTAVDEAHFEQFKVEYGLGENPLSWTQIGNIHSDPISGSTLEAWDTTDVSDGTYTLKLTVTDSPGNSSSSQVQVIVDNTPPTVSIFNPSSDDILGETINIAGTVSDDNLDSILLEYQESSNPGVWQVITALSPVSIINDTIYDWSASSFNGDYTIRVTATDKTGKTTASEVQIRFDNIQPTVNITSPSPEAVITGIFDFVGEISDLNLDNYTIKYGYGIEPTRWWDIASGSLSIVSPPSSIVSWNTSNVKDGYYTIKIDVVDKANNLSSREFVLTIDNAPAIAEIHEPTSNQVVRGTVAIYGIACDADFTTYNFKNYEVLYGEGATPASWTAIENLVVPKINEILTNWNTTALSDGIYTLKLRSADISGTTEDTKTVVVDNALPTASISSPLQGQTINGNISITGIASDTNISEYKVYYKHFDSSTWTEIGSGNSSIVSPPSSIVSWDTTLVGDGSYSLKLWVKDKAGNEREVTRDVTVNNVLAVVNDSATPTTISPNGDGIDDIVSISYMLSESSPVTVKIYKKPQYDTFKWEAKAYGTKYPIQSFSYTISGSGTDHPLQYFDYTLGASGTEYPPQMFNWTVNASGTESWSTYQDRTRTSIHQDPGAPYVDGETIGKLNSYWQGGNNVYLTHPQNVTASQTWVFVFRRENETGWDGESTSSTKLPVYLDTGWYCFQKRPCDGSFTVYFQERADHSQSVSNSDSGTATKYYSGTIGGDNSYSIILSTPHGGTISNKSISYSVTNLNGPNSYISPTSRTGNWSGNSISGSINVTYNYSGHSWSNSSNPNNRSCRSGPGSPVNYSQSISSLISVDPDVPSPAFALSGNTNSNVWLRFSDTGSSTTTNYGASVVGSTSYAPSWNSSSNGSNSCNALQGTVTASNSMLNVFGAPNTYPNYREYSGFSVSDNNPNVSVWFNNSGTTSTSDPNDYLRAKTTYSESWDTSNDPGVGNNGWIKSGEISLPYNYDESSQSFSVGYTPPSDVVLSSWAINLKNPAGGAVTDVILDGTPSANGNFEVKLANTLLVKTLQYDSLTSSGDNSIEWDGRDDNGNYVADGEYIYYIYAGPNIVKKSGMIKVKRSSEIASASLSEEYISPNGDGIKDDTVINYTLFENASVTIDILDKDGITTNSFSASGSIGQNSTSWDGKDSSNIVVEDGEYTIKIIAANSNGTQRIEELKVTVDRNSLTAPASEAQQLASSAEDPVYSPDKTKIAFAKEVSGKKQIFALNLSDSQSLQLTNSGNNFTPTWSPDGTKIVYTSDRSGNNDIWSMDSNGSNKRQITSDNASETSPVFSPDGRFIAYASNRTGYQGINKWNIWIVDVDGTNPTQVSKDENTSKDDFPSFSPDGRKLVYASDQSGNFDIWNINLDGSSKTQITSSPEVETTPAYSPDGLKITYLRGNDIYIEKLSTGEKVKIASGKNPAWSPDGMEIIYNTTNGEVHSKKVYTGSLTGVIIQPILNQTLTGLVEIRGTALDTNFENYKLEFSPNIMPYSWIELTNSNIPVNNGILSVWNSAGVPDGEYIIRLTVNDKAGNSLENTVVVNADNDNWKLTISSLNKVTSSDAWDIEPAWSPDGSKIAFSSNRSGDYDIWVMNSDGSVLQNITNDSAYDGKPVWSPDGTKIAFVSDRLGNKDIWVINADGSGIPLQLTSLTIVDTDPTWSPDGSKIAFASNRSDNFDIWIMNSDGTGTPAKLSLDEAYDKEPNWSQFGIAFTSDRSGDREIWMIEDINNPNPFRLTYNSAEDKEPNWSPIAIPLTDASTRPLITFTSSRNENLDIWVMDTDGIDQSKSLTDYTNTDCNPAWSPDGTKIAFASFKDGDYDIWVMKFDIKTTILSVGSKLSLTKPELVSPIDEEEVNTLRPTFKWKGPQGIYSEYKLMIKKEGLTYGDPIEIIKENKGTRDSREPGVLYFNYKMSEFDDALEREDYKWKVVGVTSQAAEVESEEWTFTVNPPLSVTGITNYPNPFNPNKETTKIRYRLSKDVDEVKIRIHDIAGRLVKELDGDTYGEGVSIWSKYNDVEWDGRNEAGDVVINGVYPFEVIVKGEDGSVSGRGKVAVYR